MGFRENQEQKKKDQKTKEFLLEQNGKMQSGKPKKELRKK